MTTHKYTYIMKNYKVDQYRTCYVLYDETCQFSEEIHVTPEEAKSLDLIAISPMEMFNKRNCKDD